MLILSRRVGEVIVIGDNVRLTVKSIYRGEVKLSIEAPREIPVDRLEIHERKVAEKLAQGGSAHVSVRPVLGVSHPKLSRAIET